MAEADVATSASAAAAACPLGGQSVGTSSRELGAEFDCGTGLLTGRSVVDRVGVRVGQVAHRSETRCPKAPR